MNILILLVIALATTVIAHVVNNKTCYSSIWDGISAIAFMLGLISFLVLLPLSLVLELPTSEPVMIKPIHAVKTNDITHILFTKLGGNAGSMTLDSAKAYNSTNITVKSQLLQNSWGIGMGTKYTAVVK